MPSQKAVAKAPKDKKRSASSRHAKKGSITPKALSNQFVQESEDDKDDSDVSEVSASEDGPAKRPANPKPKTSSQLPAPDASSSPSENEDDDGNEDDDSRAPEDGWVRALKPSNAESARPGPYGVPPLFQPATINDATIQKNFKKSRLEGKQIWYFTAPASVSISSIKKAPLSNLRAGGAVCSQNGSDYGFVPCAANDNCNTKIMVPHGSEGYQTVSQPIDQVFHIQRVNNELDLTPHPEALIYERGPAPSKRLKSVFFPLGCGHNEAESMVWSSSSEDSDNDVEIHPKQFKPPVSITSASSSDESGSNDEMTEAPPLSPKVATHKKQKPSEAIRHAGSTANGSTKRKHSQKPKNNIKKSSSISAVKLDNNKLKQVKTKQIEASARAHTIPPTPAIKSPIKVPKRETPVPVSKAPKKNTATPSIGTAEPPSRPTRPILPPKSTKNNHQRIPMIIYRPETA